MKLINALVEVGFRQSHMDYSLLTKKNTDGIVVILIYVDVLLIIGSSMTLIEGVKQVLKDNFMIKNLGDLRYFSGTKFAKNSIGIQTHQKNMLWSLFLT